MPKNNIKVDIFDIFVSNNVKSGLKIIFYHPNKVIFKFRNYRS